MKNTLYLFFLGAVAACTSGNADSRPGADTTAAAKTGAKKENAPANAAHGAMVDSVSYNELKRHLAAGDTSGLWPVKNDVLPLQGAILPFNRVIAYYGNLFSTRMGILGEVPKDSMFKRLTAEVAKWTAADPKIPARAALHYIAVTAQPRGTKKRLRMPFHQIDTIMKWAAEIDALVFLDVQIGHSTIEEEVKELQPYLKLPNVHFGMDPEFAMRDSVIPGKEIGTFDAKQINNVAGYLAGLVKQYNLPPKMLIIHRFTKDMVTNYQNVQLRPEVQVVLEMDGWGFPAKKVGTYKRHIQPEPIQFTGFKIFYHNDTKKSNYPRVMTPQEVLALSPKPVYIQYQ